jgi:DNA-binding NarL/FixJ family response regulator
MDWHSTNILLYILYFRFILIVEVKMNTVIIATERAELGELLRRKLEFEQDIAVQAVCHDADGLLDAVSLHTPDVVLLQSLPDRAELTKSIAELCGWTQTVWVGDRTVEDMRLAMTAGAADYLDVGQVLGV